MSRTHFRHFFARTIAVIAIASLISQEASAALLTLDSSYNVPSGMEQTPLSESKINSIQKFLFGSRSPVASSTLFDATTGKYIELSDTNSKLYGLSLSGSSFADFNGGKALWDGNVAILDLPTTGSGRLTYEAPYYCDTIISSLAKYSKIGNNICLSGYAAFSGAYANNPERTYVTVLKTDEVATADLSKFSMVVFPDITLGKHAEILDSLGAIGRANIKSFTENGGLTYFSSKSLIIADKLELTDSVVDESTLVKHHANQGKILLDSTSSFEGKLLNSGLYEGTTYASKAGSGYYDYLLGSYYLHINNDNAVVPIREFDLTRDSGYYFQDLNTLENSDIDASSAVAAFYKPYGKGLVVYNGGNSLFSPQQNSHILFRNHTLNTFLLSYSREMHASATVIQKSNPELTARLVPSLEKDILLEYDFHGMDVFTEPVSDVNLTITLAGSGIAFSSALPSGCSLTSNSGAIICHKDSVNPGEKWDISANITVNEPTFTQAGTNIAVTRTKLEYTNPKGQAIVQNLSKQTIDALASAKIRASLNIDPPGYYPLKGEGVYVDQVLDTVNTAGTEANNVEYSVTVPMISPLYDESDQSLLASKIVFSKSYYDRLRNTSTKTGGYPFKNEGECSVSGATSEGRCQDYVISSELGSGNVLVDNYDEPVKRIKTDSSDALANVNSGGLLNPIGEKITKQTYIPDADKLFMHASPRQMVFETPTKKELLFARQDVFFYNNSAFPLPKGATSRNQYISIDTSGIGCTKVDGAYNESVGVVAGKYPNALDCHTTTTNPWSTDKINFNHLPEGMEQTEYLYPIDEKNNISSASDLEGFDSDGNYTGQKDENGSTSETYPIQYRRGIFASFDLPARSTPKGGYIEITLPDGTNPASAYVSADHIAITNTEVSGNIVRAYFYRGQMPNEQSLKSAVSVALEWVDTPIASQDIKVYSLSYNLSGDPINTYALERTISTPFKSLGFLKLPAVKLKFELPRRKRISDALVNTLGLTTAQKSALFTRPDYYQSSFVFNKNTTTELSSLATRAGLTSPQKDALLSLFTAAPFESYIRKWETLSPFVRFGLYIQELAFHRTIWGPAEDHPISDPGIMADRAMIANVGNVGISPIPFAEYLTTGISQLIPLAHENGRIDYTDIFGRSFATPIRTTVPESVPLPPPVKDFMMNTTYEMYDASGNKKTYWDGESEIEVRANIKLSNNYPKYFDPTKCANNPNSASYGTCYDGSGALGYTGRTDYILSDHTLGAPDFFWTSKIQLFSTKKLLDDFLAALQSQLTASGITDYSVKTLHKVASGVDGVSLSDGEWINDKARNYSPEVERYYPEGYISNSMWNLTHLDYDDNAFSKGYPYHMDNLVPNPESGVKLPHNNIAFPINKGSSYIHKYFTESASYLQYETQNTGKIETTFHPYSSWKYSGKNGWWPENLQNRDATLTSGQTSSNTVPYEKSGNEYLKPSLLSNDQFQYLGGINVYQCLFNPYVLNPSAELYAYGANTVKNNVIPIIPWITKNTTDSFKYLSMYSCQHGMYGSDELSKINNAVETEDAFWLYFASNLRGEAKEALNVVSRISPVSGTKYEGDTKVVEWGRFTYWNPAFGPNAFQIVDNPVSIVKTINSSISLEKELLPYSLKTTSTDAYLLYTIKDPGEIEVDANGKETPRKWHDESYTDSRGNGNYGASIVVGDTYDGSAEKSLLSPGDTTLVRLDIFNNSGYDWAMLGTGTVVNNNGQFTTYISGGIDFSIVDTNQALNANDLLSKITRNVVKPTAYNFLNITIPDELKPYITISPSAANIRTPGTFSDFDNVNVTTIRDGFKGSYFLDMKVASDIPEALRGKVHDISIAVNPSYFDKIPGGNDPVNWGEAVSVPTLRFAVADNDGNAFYRNGYSTGVTLNFAYDSGFSVDSITEINEDGETALRLAAGDGTNKHRRLRETMESLSASGYAIRTFPVTVGSSGSENLGTVALSDGGISEFPYVNASGSIVPKTRVLVHLKRAELSDGEHRVESSSNVSYSNYSGVAKQSASSGALVGYAQGPKLDISYKTSLVDDSLSELEIQKLIEGNNTIVAKLFLKNTGTDIAFNPTIRLKVTDGVTIRNELLSGATVSGNTIEIKSFLSESGSSNGTEGEAVGPGITNYFPVYLSYSGSYTDSPTTLIQEASYEFTPYDPILPSLSGSSASGALSLDFVQVNALTDTGSIGKVGLTFSGNSPGIYWDGADNTNSFATKEKSDDSGILTKELAANPLVSHEIQTSAYFRGNSGDYKKIRDVSVTIPAETPYLTGITTTTEEDIQAKTVVATNILPQFGASYEATITQSGEVATGSISATQTGTITAMFDSIDVSKDAQITITAKDGSGSILATANSSLTGQWDRLYNLSAERMSRNVKLSFWTNKIGRACYLVSRDGQNITPECLRVRNQHTNFTDTDTDVFRDSAYRISIYPFASGSASEVTTTGAILVGDVIYSSPDPNTSSIPTRVVTRGETGDSLAFAKVKDFGDSYLIENTLVRYAVRMKSSDGTAIEQTSSWADVAVKYASGELLYASDGWDKTLDSPSVSTASQDENGLRSALTAEVGDANAPIVLANQAEITINNVWTKPTRVTSVHAGIRRDIAECDANTHVTSDCFVYDVNKVIIYTKLFSSFTLWNKIPTSSNSGGSGGGTLLRADYCPNGDYSSGYYDGTCGTAPSRTSSSSSILPAVVQAITPVPTKTESITNSGSLTNPTETKSATKKTTKKIKKTILKKTILKTGKASGDLIEIGDGYTIRKGGKKNVRKK